MIRQSNRRVGGESSDRNLFFLGTSWLRIVRCADRVDHVFSQQPSGSHKAVQPGKCRDDFFPRGKGQPPSYCVTRHKDGSGEDYLNNYFSRAHPGWEPRLANEKWVMSTALILIALGLVPLAVRQGRKAGAMPRNGDPFSPSRFGPFAPVAKSRSQAPRSRGRAGETAVAAGGLCIMRARSLSEYPDFLDYVGTMCSSIAL
jgi:hypothetical protein